MNQRSYLLPGLILALALTLTFFKVPLTSSQGITLVAAQVSADLPLTDADSPLWQETTAIEVPLSAQTVARPILPQTSIKAVTARALYSERQIAILVEWPDETQNDQMVRVQDFHDAVAVQFPLSQGQPFFCMGQQGGNVNIWHWRANWQADILARQDMETIYPNMYVDQYPFTDEAVAVAQTGVADYTDTSYLPALAVGNLLASASYASPVEDLVAGGFGSLTAKPAEEQQVQGYGAWEDGRWRVIFSRDLAAAGPNDVDFTPGQVYFVAFAAWDGANDERNGQKSTSQWLSLQLGEVAPAAPGEAPAPAVVPGPQARTVSTSIEGVLFALVPMVILIVLVCLAGVGMLLFFKLPDKK